jgi:uncharacterized protein (TIGR03084 family)
MPELLNDLAAEQASLDAVVANRPDDAWLTPTPAAGWDVRDSISHLCFFNETATMAVTDPEAYDAHKSALIPAMASGEAPDVAIGREAASPSILLTRWRSSQRAYIDAAAEEADRPEPSRIPWYGPSMSLASFTTARLMETWAHGQDVRDAVGAPPEVGPRLRHVIHLGVCARTYSFSAHGLEDPGDPVAVIATAPDGNIWSWGPSDPTTGANRITGTALDLALVLTQRRHPSRTGVVATGRVAEQWLAIAQAFAGPATLTDQDR